MPCMTEHVLQVANMLGATLTRDEVEEFMSEADVVSIQKIISHHLLSLLQDGNGKLDYDEFVKMMLQY